VFRLPGTTRPSTQNGRRMLCTTMRRGQLLAVARPQTVSMSSRLTMLSADFTLTAASL